MSKKEEKQKSFEEVCQDIIFNKYGVLIDVHLFSKFNNTVEMLAYYKHVFEK